MIIIRQPSLFSIRELYRYATQKYDAIISAINMVVIYYEVIKKSRLVVPTELNYAAMVISVFIRYVGHIPTMILPLNSTVVSLFQMLFRQELLILCF